MRATSVHSGAGSEAAMKLGDVAASATAEPVTAMSQSVHDGGERAERQGRCGGVAGTAYIAG